MNLVTLFYNRTRLVERLPGDLFLTGAPAIGNPTVEQFMGRVIQELSDELQKRGLRQGDFVIQVVDVTVTTFSGLFLIAFHYDKSIMGLGKWTTVGIREWGKELYKDFFDSIFLSCNMPLDGAEMMLIMMSMAGEAIVISMPFEAQAAAD